MVREPDDLLEDARQLWVRRDAASPWIIDLAMTPHEGDLWLSPRAPRVRRPLSEATFVAGDGIRYLRPELVLSMKARLARTKDDRDLAVLDTVVEAVSNVKPADIESFAAKHFVPANRVVVTMCRRAPGDSPQ